MSRFSPAILILAAFLWTGCSSSVYVKSDSGVVHHADVGSDHHLLAKAIHLEHRARSERTAAARAKRTARRLEMGKTRTELSASDRARIDREKRKARAALRKAHRLEREARQIRREVAL